MVTFADISSHKMVVLQTTEKGATMANDVFYKAVFGIAMATITGGYISFIVRTHKRSKELDKLYEDTMRHLAELK